jgi:Transposase IS66 family
MKEGCSRTSRLIEKMLEARKKGEKSLAAKMRACSGSGDAPYDVLDFRVSRHRNGPAELLGTYGEHVMGDCYSGNMSVLLAAGSSRTRLVCWSHAWRHVFDAKEVDLQTSALPLSLINQLHDVERRGSDSTSKRNAVGKKNWLLVGSMRAGIRDANLITLVACAHRHALDVYACLTDVITHLNRGTAHPAELLPDA